MEQVRTFIAIYIPPAAQAILAAVQKALQSVRGAQDCVKWVRPEIVHLTLQFLGDVPASRIEAVGDSVAQACAGVPAFTLRVTGAGAYPNCRRPRVLWVGLAGELDTLAYLRSMVERELAELGFRPEDREFSPHLTLGRVRQGADQVATRALGEAVAGLCIEEGEPFRVEAVHAMRSDLGPAGPTYTRLRTVPLLSEVMAAPPEPDAGAAAPPAPQWESRAAPGQMVGEMMQAVPTDIRHRPFVAVIGASECDAAGAAQAEEVGRRLAEAGAVLVCGGRGGVMEAACRGAKSAGGLTIGILPGPDRSEANPYVDIPIVTGIGFARNIIVVSTAQAAIAISGSYGTLSEIAYALQRRLPLVALGSWQLARGGHITSDVPVVATPAEAVARILALIRQM